MKLRRSWTVVIPFAMTLIQLSIPNEARLLHSSLHSFYKYSSWLPTPLAASEVLGVAKTPRFSGCGAESIYSRRTCIPPPPRLGIFPQCYHSGGIRPRASTMSVESRIINAEGCGVCPKKNKKKKKEKKSIHVCCHGSARISISAVSHGISMHDIEFLPKCIM